MAVSPHDATLTSANPATTSADATPGDLEIAELAGLFLWLSPLLLVRGAARSGVKLERPQPVAPSEGAGEDERA